MDSDRGSTRRKRKVKHRFFVPPSRLQPASEGKLVALDADTAHHLRTVLRLGPGSGVLLFDNSGREYEAEVVESKPSGVRLKVLGFTQPRVESPLGITLAQALLKGNALDHVLTLCTELGLNRFIPLVTSRTVVKLRKPETGERVRRWEKIVQAAAAQSGRVKVPIVEPPLEFKDFLARKLNGTKIILWERGGSGQWKEILEDGRPEAVTLVVGPEGGFEQAEVKLALEAGFKVWGLGPRLFRAEMAGAIAMTVLQFEWGDLG